MWRLEIVQPSAWSAPLPGDERASNGGYCFATRSASNSDSLECKIRGWKCSSNGVKSGRHDGTALATWEWRKSISKLCI